LGSSSSFLEQTCNHGLQQGDRVVTDVVYQPHPHPIILGWMQKKPAAVLPIIIKHRRGFNFPFPLHLSFLLPSILFPLSYFP
jgi:hypothetical protein